MNKEEDLLKISILKHDCNKGNLKSGYLDLHKTDKVEGDSIGEQIQIIKNI